MHTFYRRLYRLLLRLHPTAFRNEFAREMALDFEDALYTYGLGRLFIDATGSLGRQWWARILSGAPDPISAPRPSLLAGNYVMVRDESFTPLELGRGVIASAAQLALCLFALSAGPEHVPNFPIVYAASAPAQTGQQKPELLLLHPSSPLPSYEVATVKPIDPDAASSMVKLPPGVSLSPLSVRRYIMNAYGAVDAQQIVGGPDWLNKDAYQINGKVPDDLGAALQKMTREQRNDQTRLMQQRLLAERFRLKAHFETRVLPVYELVPGKDGLKITEVAGPPELKPGDPPVRVRQGDPLSPGTMMSTANSNGLRVLNGRAIKMQLLARVIGGEIGGRPVVNHTGFTGYFDINDLTWAPSADAGAGGEPDGSSLASALEENLGVRLLPAKDPIEVLVIDGIERPTPN